MDIKKIREQLGLTQDQLAVLIGYSQTSISLMEHGERSITDDFIEKMKELLMKSKLKINVDPV